MSRNRYESKRTTTRFKQIGQGLRAGEDRIREQRKTEIDALKLAREQEKERNQAFISGLGDKFKFEEGVFIKLRNPNNNKIIHSSYHHIYLLTSSS